jgi:hypothetical protein
MAELRLAEARLADAQWLNPGFTQDSLLNHLFKKSVNRTDTSLRTSYFKEPLAQPKYFLDYLATENIPTQAPDDFEVLTNTQIADLFKITEAEIAVMSTTLEGAPAFSIQRSASHPCIVRVENLLMKPYISNINNCFTGITPFTDVNMLSTVIPFSFGNGSYRGSFRRTMGGGALSMEGKDVILPQQLAFIFDYDTGFFLAHTNDKPSTSPNHIQSGCPPTISCFIYIGSFGKLGWQIRGETLFMKENHLVIGKDSLSNPSYILDVSGSAFVSDIVCMSVSSSSDIRLKTNIHPAPTCREILNIQPYFYRYKTRPDVEEFGVMAQEVEKIFPSCVRTNADGFKSVCYDKLGVALLPIVKKQQDEIDLLNAEMKEIKKALISFLEMKE